MNCTIKREGRSEVNEAGSIYLSFHPFSLCFWLAINPLSFEFNPLCSAAPLPPYCVSREHLAGRDKSSMWDQLEDAAMETFSLSRADLFHLLTFYVCA